MVVSYVVVMGFVRSAKQSRLPTSAHTLSNVSRRGSYGFVYMPIAYEYVLRYALDIFARITTCSVLVVLLHGNVEVVTPEVPN